MEEEVGTVIGQVPKTVGSGSEDSRAGCLPQTLVDPCAQSPCPRTRLAFPGGPRGFCPRTPAAPDSGEKGHRQQAWDGGGRGGR